MNRIKQPSFIGLFIAFALLTSLLGANWIAAQVQTPFPEVGNGTRLDINVKNNSIALVNTTTNETIAIKNYAEYVGNTTTNETITSKNFTENDRDNTTIVNLTEKFKTLGK